MRILSILLFVQLFSQISFTQTRVDSLQLIQLSGVVVNEEDLTPLPYTTLYDRTQRRGVISDYYGFFSTVVLPGDTLLFSSFGFKTSTYVVPDTLRDSRYSIIHVMQKDTVNLPEVTVYPWPSREDFARYFVNMQPYDDALRRAQRELSGETLAFVAARLDGDASLAYGTVSNQRNTRLYTNGQLPANNLLNPYSWAKLIQDWKQGKLSRQ
ncbi:MAG: carboxypeptidase-like regulatory domain-containing protein [Crocinitomicaceae bacterium]|nr:carboxypeptidase-like regulatory domain-containing protein [Crocinitomicaceae bacterium]MCF8433261.1 carboxypeptidase-like regulatory domain-containing protein [Crocinitomicaceae bacterium]MDP5011070.1 carboxypeptidase-like regulatory domain-containing protein [Crocinitomicaceae bacterium]